MKRILCLILSVVCVFGTLFLSACGDTENTDFATHVENADSTVKKGVGVSRYNNQNGKQNLDNLNLGWYYNWGLSDPFNGSGEVGEYVPMIWGRSSVTPQNLQIIKDGYESGKFKYLLTFNEPDHPDQSNMSVEEALSYWPQLEAIGIPLSSPCPCDYSTGWLDEFMKEAKKKNYRVDFIAVHCYQDFSVEGIENKMKSDVLNVIYEKYQLPIWVTEFGAVDIKFWETKNYTAACNQAAAERYVKKSCEMLEKLGFVERYAWFLDNYSERLDPIPNPQEGGHIPYEGRFSALYNNDDTISKTGSIFKSINSIKPLFISTENLPNGRKNESYVCYVNGLGGQGNYTFSGSGLPKGLTINKAGKISGKPSVTGEFTAKITITDEKGQSTYKNFVFTIS